jgi:hypothetical protein
VAFWRQDDDEISSRPLEAAKKFVLTAEDKEQQRRSFAYGKTVIENSRITREMVDRAGWRARRAWQIQFRKSIAEEQVPVRPPLSGQSPSTRSGLRLKRAGLDFAFRVREMLRPA